MNRAPLRRLAAVLLVGCAGLMAAGLLQYGYDSLSAITLSQDPARIWVYAVLPAVGILLALCLLFFPPWVGINLLGVMALWTALEMAHAALLPRAPKVEGELTALHAEDYLVDHSRVGYVLARNDEGRHRKVVDGVVDYDVRYVIDTFGRRKIEAPHAGAPGRFLLFFGDSNTFGEGLPQGDTLPDEMQRRWPDALAYNYGVHGYGMAQMRDVIASRDLPSEVEPRGGVAFYYFIAAHMGRLVGSSDVAPYWGRRFSYYELRNGRPERLGNFVTGRRFLTLFYGLFNESNVREYYGVTLPPFYSQEDYALAGALVAESRDELRRRFSLDDFYFVLSPTTGTEQQAISERIAATMQGLGMPVIDLTKALSLYERRYRVADGDFHQSAEANRLLAERISHRLSTDHPDFPGAHLNVP